MLLRENRFIRFTFYSPHLRVTVLHRNPPTDEEWSFTTSTIQHFYDAAEQGHTRLAICFDLRQMGVLPIRRYMDWARLFLDNKDRTATCVLATCIVTGSALVRGAVNGFFTMYTPVRPFRMVDTMEEGVVWLGTQSCPETPLPPPPSTPSSSQRPSSRSGDHIVLRQRVSRATVPEPE